MCMYHVRMLSHPLWVSVCKGIRVTYTWGIVADDRIRRYAPCFSNNLRGLLTLSSLCQFPPRAEVSTFVSCRRLTAEIS